MTRLTGSKFNYLVNVEVESLKVGLLLLLEYGESGTGGRRPPRRTRKLEAGAEQHRLLAVVLGRTHDLLPLSQSRQRQERVRRALAVGGLVLERPVVRVAQGHLLRHGHGRGDGRGGGGGEDVAPVAVQPRLLARRRPAPVSAAVLLAEEGVLVRGDVVVVVDVVVDGRAAVADLSQGDPASSEELAGQPQGSGLLRPPLRVEQVLQVVQ